MAPAAHQDGQPGHGQDVCIRKAELRDLEAIMRFNQAMAKETESIDIPDATARSGVEGVLKEGGAAHGSALYYLLLQDSQPIGQLMITLEWSDWRAAYVWWIQSVYVQPGFRGQGHFRRLYEHVRQEAQQQGAAGLRLYADDDNTTAHATVQGTGKRLWHARCEAAQEQRDTSVRLLSTHMTHDGI